MQNTIEDTGVGEVSAKSDRIAGTIYMSDMSDMSDKSDMKTEKMSDKTAIIMIGIQVSGKSTFCRMNIPDNFVRISLDDLNTRNREKILLSECIAKEKNIVIDNTNPTKADRKRYIPVLKKSVLWSPLSRQFLRNLS